MKKLALMKNDISHILGFAAKSRSLVLGQDRVISVLKQRPFGCIVLIASDVTDSLSRKLRNLAGDRKLLYSLTIDSSEMGNMVGLDKCKVLLIPDTAKGFYEKIESLMIDFGGDAVE